MATNLEAIRKRIQELSGQRKTSTVQFWKPTAGKHLIRGLPWKNTEDGMPFIERRFYYIGANSGFPAPSQFGKPDPINDLIRKLYSSKSPDDREMAKKLQPKMRIYMPIIDRNEEEKGVQVWAFNRQTYQRLLGFYEEEDVGDILDVEKGFDLKVVLTQSSKKVEGKSFMEVQVDAARNPSKLHANPDTMKKWLDSVPNIDDAYRQRSPQEIEDMLNKWLSGDTDQPTGDGTSRGGEEKMDELQKIADEVAATTKPSTVENQKADKAEKPQQPKPRVAKKHVDLDEEDDVSDAKKSIDDVFKELTED